VSGGGGVGAEAFFLGTYKFIPLLKDPNCFVPLTII
jgi:hypothetical protein